MNFLIFGLGKTGLSALKYLKAQGHACLVFDTRSKPLMLTELREAFPDVSYFLEDFPDKAWEGIDSIVVSPGLNPEEPKIYKILQEAKRRNLIFTSDIELFLKVVQAEKFSKVIGITGSNGKSTVTALVGEMLKSAGYNSKIGGNFGIPALDLLASQEGKTDYYVLELSSFQLELLSEPPELFVGALLNISPNHLDRHKNLENYQRIKEHIYLGSDFKVINRSMKYLLNFNFNQESEGVPVVRSFGLDLNFSEETDFGVKFFQGQEWLYGQGAFLMPVSEIKLLGRHNIENALAALAIVSVIHPSCVREALSVLKFFEGLPHRCKWVRKIDGVDWVNDSKSTTCASTSAALKGFGPEIVARGGKIILIAGGQAKGATFEVLAESVSEYAKALLVFGQDAKQLVQDLKNYVLIYPVKDLEAAIDQASQIAEPNDLVLLSPACASLDMFKSYEQRGEVFEKVVLSLSEN